MPGHQKETVERIDTLLDSTLESVDTGERMVLALAERMGFEEDALHQLGMAVRETMVNAVVHGNKYSAIKKVHLVADPDAGGLRISIGDQGDGFDRSGVPDPLARENLLRQSGRGLLLMEAFVDKLEILRAEPKGTEVVMVKYLARQ